MTPYEESLILYLRGQVGPSEFSDFTIVSIDQQEFPTSKTLLLARSKYYQALLRQEPSRTTSNLDFNGDLLKIVLRSLVTADFGDCSFDQLLELLTFADYLEMPEMLNEIETILSNKLSMENIYQVMACTKIIISSLSKLQDKVNQLMKENILFIDLNSVPEDWMRSAIRSPFTNVRDKHGRFLDVVESELMVVMTLYDHDPTKEWILSHESKENIARGLQKIASRINQRKAGTELTRKEWADNYDNFHTLIHGKEDKVKQLKEKFKIPSTAGLPFPNTRVYWTPDKREYGRFGSGVAVSWQVNGFFRKIYVREGCFDPVFDAVPQWNEQVVRWMNFLTDEGELMLPTDLMPEIEGDTQEARLTWLERNTKVLTVPEGQHIKDVILRSSMYIDQIGFVTNTGKILGPVGGTGGNQRNVYKESFERGNPNRKKWGHYKKHYLCGLTGEIFEDGGTPLMTRVKFIFARISQPKSRERVYDVW